MAPKHLIVKRHGHMEEFDEKKIYGSVYAATLNAHHSEHKAEELAEKISKKLKKKFSKKDHIDSENIRDEIIKELENDDHEIAYLYRHHLDIN